MILLAAGDAGPRDTLRPLLDAVETWLPDAADGETATEAYWLKLIRARAARGIVCGTSDSAGGKAVEAAARRVAAAAGIPAVVIEDFPGNYYDVPGGSVALLIVESAAVASFARSKFGAACPLLQVLSPARYDTYRREAPALRARVRESWADTQSEPAILWAGQPETEDCVRTLRCLLPLIKERGLVLLFKAHPRDAGHASGVYEEWFAGFDVRHQDVTSLTVPASLSLAPRLVATQFSSVAIEAGFYGIPGLNILLPDAGGPRLLAKKGYAIPPYCECGAAAHVVRSEDVAAAFRRALEDPVQRENIVRCFDAYFRTGIPMLPALVARLESVFGICQISP